MSFAKQSITGKVIYVMTIVITLKRPFMQMLSSMHKYVFKFCKDNQENKQI